jgi:hypothetical protein
MANWTKKAKKEVVSKIDKKQNVFFERCCGIALSSAKFDESHRGTVWV